MIFDAIETTYGCNPWHVAIFSVCDIYNLQSVISAKKIDSLHAGWQKETVPQGQKRGGDSVSCKCYTAVSACAMSPGITMFLGCCSLDPPSPRNPLTGCFFIAKLVKHIVQLSHRYFFFFLLLLLSLRCSFVFIASIYLFGASCQ